MINKYFTQSTTATLAVIVLILSACGAPAPLAQPGLLPTAAIRLPVVVSGPAPVAATATAALIVATPVPTAIAPAPTMIAPTMIAPTAIAPTIRIAVIGDFGLAGANEANVAALVKSWHPQDIITTGDNNYPAGAADTIDANIGQYYHEFIAPYTGSYGPGAAANHFFPVLGNHDWQTANSQPYRDYFTLPGNERYYTADIGPLRLFAVDSMPDEPDGTTAESAQGAWLEQQLAASTACWNVVAMHHPPFSSGLHGSSAWMQWPYAAWGADLVLAGHDHSYERFDQDGIPYIVNGLGGGALYALHSPIAGSKVQFAGAYGAMLLEAGSNSLHIQFITVDGTLVDDMQLAGGCAR